MSHRCPKCQVRSTTPQEICPGCGLVYRKWLARQLAPPRAELSSPRESLMARCQAQFLAVPDAVDPSVFYGRAALLLALGLWSLYFITGGVNWERIGGSFLHNVNLPFHEFGHVFFSPFGEFMMILGGSLFQVTMPLALLFAFSIARRDNFGASVMLWWSGQNFIDVSPYIADAQWRALPLVGGRGEESHDWGNLLTMTGNLAHTQTIAHSSFLIGVCLMVLALIWGAYLCLAQKNNLADLIP